jgi:hypothetical protein
VVVTALQVELPTASTSASNPDLAMVKVCRKANLDMDVGEGARSLHLKVTRIMPELVMATWEVHRPREILRTTSWVPGYSENPVTQQRSSHV